MKLIYLHSMENVVLDCPLSLTATHLMSESTSVALTLYTVSLVMTLLNADSYTLTLYLSL